MTCWGGVDELGRDWMPTKLTRVIRRIRKCFSSRNCSYAKEKNATCELWELSKLADDATVASLVTRLIGYVQDPVWLYKFSSD